MKDTNRLITVLLYLSATAAFLTSIFYDANQLHWGLVAVFLVLSAIYNKMDWPVGR